MSVMEHLEELRKRVVISVIAIAIAAIVAYVFYKQILDLLVDPHCSLDTANNLVETCKLLATSPLEGFSVRLTVSAYSGTALAMPVVLWQIWKFVAPGLYPEEKKYGLSFVLSAFLLFVLGVVLAYWTLPRALDFLASVGGDGLVNFYRPKEYISFVVKMMLGFGIGFEFPIVLIFAQLLGAVKAHQLKAMRRYAIVGIVVLVAVLTPSGDPISLTILSVPMYLFYEAAIYIGGWLNRKRA